MEIDGAEDLLAGRHAGAVLDCVLVDAFARCEYAAGEIHDRADCKLAQIGGRGRQIEVRGYDSGHVHSAAVATGSCHSTVDRRI